MANNKTRLTMCFGILLDIYLKSIVDTPPHALDLHQEKSVLCVKFGL